MDRRRYLALVGITGASVAIAGCSDGDDTETDDAAESPDEEPGDDDDESTEETGNGADEDEDAETVEALIDSADEHLDEAETLFETQLDQFEQDDSESIETAEIIAQLDEASTALEEARPLADDDQLTRIEALDGILQFLRAFVDAFGELSAAVETFATAEEQIETEQWGEAIETLGRAEEDMAAADEKLDDARAEFEAIETEDLDASTRLEFEDLESDLDEFERLFFGLDILITSLRQYTEGLQPLDEGLVAIDEENYEEAASQFETAAERFGESIETLREAEGEVPADLQADIDETICEFSAVRDATEHYEEAARLLDDGNIQEGEDRFAAGNERLAEGGDC